MVEAAAETASLGASPAPLLTETPIPKAGVA
jgi:hypothetical protein